MSFLIAQWRQLSMQVIEGVGILRQLSVVTSSMQQSYERDVHSCVPRAINDPLSPIQPYFRLCVTWISRESAVEGQIAGRDSRIEIRLHPRWLSEVWARGLAVHCGRFTVSISEELGNVTLTQVEWVEGIKDSSRV